MAIFADTVRKVAILQTTQHLWKGNAPKWRTDMQAICDAKVEHFEKLTAILARHGQQSMQEMMRAAAEHKLLPLFKALQYITFQTANIPLTQGYKVGIRQLGFALNIYDGPLTIFLTTNFADIYSPISHAHERSRPATGQARNQSTTQRSVHAHTAGHAPGIGQTSNATSAAVPSNGRTGTF